MLQNPKLSSECGHGATTVGDSPLGHMGEIAAKIQAH